MNRIERRFACANFSLKFKKQIIEAELERDNEETYREANELLVGLNQ